MEQKWETLAALSGKVSSWKSFAVSGSSERLNWSSQRNSKRAFESALSLNLCAWVALGEVRRVGGDFVGDDAGLHIFAVGEAQVFFGRHITEHGTAKPPDHGCADAGGDVVVARRDVGRERSQRIEGRFLAGLQLFLHIDLDHVHGHVARAFDHNLDIVAPGNLGEFTQGVQLGELRFIVGIGNGAWAQSIAQTERHVVGLHDLADFFEVACR